VVSTTFPTLTEPLKNIQDLRQPNILLSFTKELEFWDFVPIAIGIPNSMILENQGLGKVLVPEITDLGKSASHGKIPFSF
jgi:hypothetical protein